MSLLTLITKPGCKKTSFKISQKYFCKKSMLWCWVRHLWLACAVPISDQQKSIPAFWFRRNKTLLYQILYGILQLWSRQGRTYVHVVRRWIFLIPAIGHYRQVIQKYGRQEIADTLLLYYIYGYFQLPICYNMQTRTSKYINSECMHPTSDCAQILFTAYFTNALHFCFANGNVGNSD